MFEVLARLLPCEKQKLKASLLKLNLPICYFFDFSVNKHILRNSVREEQFLWSITGKDTVY